LTFLEGKNDPAGRGGEPVAHVLPTNKRHDSSLEQTQKATSTGPSSMYLSWGRIAEKKRERTGRTGKENRGVSVACAPGGKWGGVKRQKSFRKLSEM